MDDPTTNERHDPNPGELLEQYQRHLIRAQLASGSIRNYRGRVAEWVDWAIDNGHDPCELDVLAVRQWSTTLVNSESTRQMAMAAIMHLADMVDRDRADVGGAIERPRRSRPASWKPLTDAETRRLLAAADAAGRPGTAVYLGLYAALRRIEITQMRWENVDLDGRALIAYRSKVDDWHRVPMHPKLHQRLEPRHGGEGWVFPGPRGGHLSPNTIGDWIRNLALEAGLQGVHTHRLRHTCATRVYAATKDLMACKALLGHQLVTTTQRYVSVTSDVIATALGSLDYGDGHEVRLRFDDLADAKHGTGWTWVCSCDVATDTFETRDEALAAADQHVAEHGGAWRDDGSAA